MPKLPNEKSGKARHMYEKGLKLVEIARRLGVPEGTVRRWKHDYDWDKKKQNERSEKEKPNVRKKIGAPKGNKNAVGNPGNKNAVPPDTTKHGGYSKIYWDQLDDEEKALIEQMPKDEETLLIQQLQLYSLRERRIMKAISRYKDTNEDMAVTMVTTAERRNEFSAGSLSVKTPLSETEEIIQSENKDNIVMRLEQELSTVQRAKTQAITALARLHFDKMKLEGDTTKNDVAKAWVEQVLKGRESK